MKSSNLWINRIFDGFKIIVLASSSEFYGFSFVCFLTELT